MDCPVFNRYVILNETTQIKTDTRFAKHSQQPYATNVGVVFDLSDFKYKLLIY